MPGVSIRDDLDPPATDATRTDVTRSPLPQSGGYWSPARELPDRAHVQEKGVSFFPRWFDARSP
jgi:hypothetical protein